MKTLYSCLLGIIIVLFTGISDQTQAAAAPAEAEVRLTSTTEVRFASREEARALLGTRDEYVRSMGAFDRALRLKSTRPVSEAEYLNLTTSSALAWAPADREAVVRAIAALRPALSEYPLPFPPTILMIQTNGRDEWDNAYTRGNAIILPRLYFQLHLDMKYFVAHEAFHVLTRANPKLREALYACIGFRPCGAVTLPPTLEARRITNPDAPVSAFYCTVVSHGSATAVLPVLFSNREQYNGTWLRGLDEYLDYKLLAIEKAEGKWRAKVMDGKPVLLDYDEVEGFYEKVGRNTRYIIQPEEILADNFAFLMMGRPGLPSPGVVAAIKKELLSFSENRASNGQDGQDGREDHFKK